MSRVHLRAPPAREGGALGLVLLTAGSSRHGRALCREPAAPLLEGVLGREELSCRFLLGGDLASFSDDLFRGVASVS